MRRWSGGLVLALAMVALLAASTLGAGGDRVLISSAKRVDERPFRGVVLVSVGNSTVCTGFVVAPRK
ncbi:MAG: hypothetical protein ACC726_06920, partial [Chloroflexota bacterium]